MLVMEPILNSFTIILMGLLVSSYFGYPLLIEFIKKSNLSSVQEMSEDCRIHLLIPCFNEDAVIEEKIHNSFLIDYPRSFSVYVIIDKSDDKTFEKASQLQEIYPDLVVWNKGYRKGKNDSINFFYKKVRPNSKDIIFLTDANTFFEKDSFMHLWREFEAGAHVVGGSMHYVDKMTTSAKSEGVYWRYEEWIRENESKLGRCITMNGGNMAMLAVDFEELQAFVPNDFDIPLRLVSNYKTSFAKHSVGREVAILDSDEELARKRRMANRQMNAVLLRWGRLDVRTKIQLTLHKIVRWFALFIVFVIYLLQAVSFMTIGVSWIGLLLFSLAGIVSLALIIEAVKPDAIPGAGLIAYAVKVHFYSGIGAFQALVGRKVALWGGATTNRKTIAP